MMNDDGQLSVYAKCYLLQWTAETVIQNSSWLK